MKNTGTDELLNAIRKHCLECSGGSVKNADGCRMEHCHLHPYRSNAAIGNAKKQIKLKGQISAFDLLKGGRNGQKTGTDEA